ncbi:DUF6270 domain-containing protein [Acinetobacter thermotolerans]|uniref:DUF6270 domain-containing protein n=1 Tax=Acinetobacter thermotolerans TaxID=3151487 RepID=UPI00325B754F
MASFDVFGGCVSRDLFEFPSKPGDVHNYFARTSLVSQLSNSLDVSPDAFSMNSPFQKRMILNDLNKGFYKYLQGDQISDYLVLDCLVERLNICFFGNGIFTSSSEYDNSGLNLSGTIISRERHVSMFDEVVLNFKPYLKKYKKIFLNKFYHAYDYRGGDGKLMKFNNYKYISGENEFLDRLYSILEIRLDNLIVINFSDYLADAGHKWGLTTYHFEESYYHRVNQRIKTQIQIPSATHL